MAKLLDCEPLATLEFTNPALVVSVALNTTYLEKAGAKMPALTGTWSTISDPYIAGIQFEVGPTDLSQGLTMSSANKGAQSWVRTDGVIAAESYTIRYRAIGVLANTFGPWSTPEVVVAGDEWLAGGFVGAGDLAYENSISWGGGLLTSRPTELTDGRVSAGLDASGVLQTVIPTVLADSSNILRRSGGGIFTGALAATAGATWGTDVGSRPAELTDGRITAGLNSSGVLQTAIPSTLADTSNILRRTGGGVFTGALAATAGATWGTDVASRPAELTDGRVATGLNSFGVLQTAIPSALADTSNILRRTAGGLFTGDLAATLGAAWGSTLTGRPTELTDGRITTALNGSGVLQTAIPSTLADTSNILRRTGGGVFTGALAATAGATWGTDVASRPAELTDGRITTGLNSSGILQTAIPSGLADTSNLLRRAAGGLFTGSLAATAGATWGTDIASRPTELTDGRVATGLDASGVLQTAIPVALANTSNLLRRAGGGAFTGNLNATDDSAVTALSSTLGPLSTSALTEAKVRGRWFGEYAGEAAALSAGLQEGDTWIDTTRVPPATMARGASSSIIITAPGTAANTATNKSVTSTSQQEIITITRTGLEENSFGWLWFTMTIQAGVTASASSGVQPFGTWRIVDITTGTEVIMSGVWSTTPGAGSLIDTITIDGRQSATVSRSMVTSPIVLDSGSRTYALQMTRDPTSKNLSNFTPHIYFKADRAT